jgi:hypothetical protein
MKNFVVITLGTSDVQVKVDLLEKSDFELDGLVLHHKHRQMPSVNLRPNRDRQDSRLLNQCRVDGETITNAGIDSYLSVLDFPLTLPAIQTLIENNPEHKIHKWLFVYTDQKDSLHRLNDTVFVRQILARKIELEYGASMSDFIDFPVTEKIPDIDHQYVQFGLKCQHFLLTPEQEVGQVVLLAQGGIDQINQALTLQLTQAFKHKLQLYQKAEDRDPSLLKFPRLFLNDLNKQKIYKHLEDYDFGLISGLLSDDHPKKDIIDAYAKFAYYKLNLNYTAFPSGIPSHFKEKPITTETRCRDLYISAKILYHQKDYGNYLFRMYTLLENMYRVKFDQIVGNSDGLFDAKYENPQVENTVWLNLLRNYSPLNPVDGYDLFNYLSSRKIGRNNLKINNPNRHLYKHGYDFLIRSGALTDSPEYVRLLEKADSILSQLSNFRNKATHNLAPVSIEQLNNAIGKGKLDELNDVLDQIFSITGFGIYDTIHEEIKALL